jgi:hypothetical protein
VVSIVVKLWMDSGGIVVGFLAMAKFFFLLQNVQTGQGAQRVSYSLSTRRALSPGKEAGA